MAILMILLDGMANQDYASCATLKAQPVAGYRNNTPAGLEADSLSCILTLLGVKAKQIPKGRSYLEALALDLPVAEGDLVFRCNAIETDLQGRLISAGKLGTTKAMTAPHFYLHPIEGYKYLLVVPGAKSCFEQIVTYPPHQNLGKPLKGLLPQAPPPLQEILLSLILQKGIFPWGQGVRQDLPAFKGLHGGKGAMVAKTEIALGIGKALGMTCPVLQRATADWDTDLQEKAATALALTADHDFVVLHINGIDECSHRKNSLQKQGLIQAIDKQVLAYLLENAAADLSIILTADHETDCKQGIHLNSPVCYYLLNQTKEGTEWLAQL